MVAASATPPSPCSKCSVNPSNNTSKPLKASGKSWEGLHNSLLMASPSTASQLTATSRTPLTDIRFSTGTPKSLNEGNDGFCEIPQCPECLQAYWEPHQLPCASLLAKVGHSSHLLQHKGFLITMSRSLVVQKEEKQG